MFSEGTGPVIIYKQDYLESQSKLILVDLAPKRIWFWIKLQENIKLHSA